MTARLLATELERRLRGDALTLAFDTNAIFSHRRFYEVCDAINQWNDGQRSADPVKLVLCSVAYGEKLLDMRQVHQVAAYGNFDEAKILKVLAQKNVDVCPFASEHAGKMSALLHRHYPSQATWQAAKRELYIQRLGAQALRQQIPGLGRTCSATVDWLIAAHAQMQSSVLVTDDQGEEFAQITDQTQMKELEAALAALGVWPAPSRSMT